MQIKGTWRETILWLLGAALAGVLYGYCLAQPSSTMGRIWFANDPWATNVDYN